MGKDQNERTCFCGEMREKCWLKEGKGKTNGNWRDDKRERNGVAANCGDDKEKKRCLIGGGDAVWARECF